MRYYSIKIDGAPTDIFPPRYDGGAQWGTILNGVHDPNAQQIEFQIQEWDPTSLTENSLLTIYGVSWDQIKNSQQLVNKPITVEGGMSPGLPLATVQSQRDKLLLQGTIIKCWGNWIGNETSIGMTFVSAGAAAAEAGSGGGGVSGSGGGGGGGGGSGLRLFRGIGPRSMDRRPFSRGVVEPGAFNTVVNIGGQLLPNLASGVSAVNEISAAAQQLLSDFNIGAASTTIGGVVNSFFGGGSISPLGAPLNIIHNLLPNIPLSNGIQETLSKVFPQAALDIRISPLLKLAYQDSGIYQAIEQYAGYINNLSQSILGTQAYPGVHLSSYNNTIRVWDGSYQFNNDTISYLDLIGQPTWLTINTISVKVVLRGGLHVGDTLVLPQTLVNFAGPESQQAGVPDQRTHVTLPGSYIVTKILHIGDFRNPDGASWSTNYEAAGNPSMTGSAAAAQQADAAEGNQNPGSGSQGQVQVHIGPVQVSPNQPSQGRMVRRSVRRYG